MTDRPFSDISYQQYLSEGKLMGCKCQQCDSLYVPPRPICPQCHSSGMSWVQMKGAGTLATFTCISVPPPSLEAQGFGRGNPYCVGVVNLEEGPSVVARIVDVDTHNPENIKVGGSMEAVYLVHDSNEPPDTLLAFRPKP